MDENTSGKTKTILLGAIIGALAGAAGAYILLQQAEQNHAKPKLSAGEGVKVGLGVLGLLRMVSELGAKH